MPHRRDRRRPFWSCWCVTLPVVIAAGGVPAQRARARHNDPPAAPTSQPAGGGANDLSHPPASSQPSSQPSTQPGDAASESDAAAATRKPYPKSKSPSTSRHPDRPDYIHAIDPFDPADGENRWMDWGLEHRSRYELRNNDYRNGIESDSRWHMRTRGYLGIREVLDPFRFGVEFQDSRAFGNDFPDNTSDINEYDVLQLFGELYFPDAVGDGQPLSIRAGRMSFDAIDRRLFSRNGYRNTTNSHDGFRLRIGDETSPWEFDFFAVQPVERFLRRRDHGDDERWLYALNGYWRGWAPIVTLEPYYFILDKDRKTAIDRVIHTMGMHGFGLIGKSGFDYDFNFAYQWGHFTGGRHRAFATHAELGYTFEHDWKPRLAFMFDYASGDENPTDRTDERFNSLFGSSRTFYGFSEMFGWNNIIISALHLSAKPTDKLSASLFYRAYWLASDRDPFVRAGIRDANGYSGTWVGHEVDASVTYQLNEITELELGLAHFMPGTFTRYAGGRDVDDTNAFFVQVVLTP